MPEEIINKMLEDMKGSLSSLQKELVKVRTGKATPALLDSVQVEYYGSNVPINQVANVTTPDARTIQVVPWESNMIAPVEKAILAANLGMTPQNDGKVVRVPMPPLTEERRKEMVKTIKKMGEECKISVRNHRREGNESMKKLEKDKSLSKDDTQRHLESIQKETDSKIKEIDVLIEKKEKEILTV